MTSNTTERYRISRADANVRPPVEEKPPGNPRDGAVALLVIVVLVLLALLVGWPVAVAALGGGLIGAALRDPSPGRMQQREDGR